MLKRHAFGQVRFFEMGRSLFGRTPLTAGVYTVDGLMVDTGPASTRKEFRQVLEETGVERIVLTHHHEDHVGNAALAARTVGAEPLAHELALEPLRNPPPLPLYRRFVWGAPEAVEAEPIPGSVETRRHRFRVLHLPGHAEDHVALHEPDERWIFCGDLYLADRIRLLRDDEDVTALIASLRELLRLPDCVLFCQHTGVHPSHHERIGHKLDYLLGLQKRALVLRDEGRSPDEVARELGLQNRLWSWVSGGEFSGRNLVDGLLADADAEPPGDR